MKLHYLGLSLLIFISLTACQPEQEAAPTIETAPSDAVSPEATSAQAASSEASSPEPTIASTESTAVQERPTAVPTMTATGDSDVESETEGKSTVEGASMSDANADVTFVRAVRSGDGSWTFHVTVQHPDSGWEDYADGWDVVLPDGAVLKSAASDPFTRLLLHPHEAEQPFTRSQSGLLIPDEIESVSVRAHDLVDGFGGQEVIVNLLVDSGPNFVVERP